MNIAIVTNAVYDVVPEFVVLTDLLKFKYASRHGVSYVRTSSMLHPGIHAAWQKPAVVLDAMEKYDWIVWMDTDAAPVNMDFDLAGYLSGVGDNVVMQKDIMGWNSGVFAIPNTSRCMAWMRFIESLRNEERYASGFWEQQAVSDSFNMDEWRGIPVEPPSWIGWNSYLSIYGERNDPNKYVNGHWVMHVPACPNGDRTIVFNVFVENIYKNCPQKYK